MKKAFMLMALVYICHYTYAQTDTLEEKTLDNLVISANKWEQKLNEVPNKIVKINKFEILRNNPQTSADLLGQSGSVFIQKSQLGGGSPMIRGFATNRVLLVADGVRMNNAIYRSGNLQNVISIDPLSVESAEVIFGPGSLIYGSDAIGGVMDFHTLEPRFSTDKKTLVKGSVLGRYSTANKEKTIHADINLGWQKWSILSSFSYSDFDDLKMGKNGRTGQDNYLRPEYVERINNKDSIVQNSDPRVQRFSGYNQTNFCKRLVISPIKTGICNTFLRMPAPAMHLATTD
jgi:hemoglobin/transferrin/lactoferrin receptor protein